MEPTNKFPSLSMSTESQHVLTDFYGIIAQGKNEMVEHQLNDNGLYPYIKMGISDPTNALKVWVSMQIIAAKSTHKQSANNVLGSLYNSTYYMTSMTSFTSYWNPQVTSVDFTAQALKSARKVITSDITTVLKNKKIECLTNKGYEELIQDLSDLRDLALTVVGVVDCVIETYLNENDTADSIKKENVKLKNFTTRLNEETKNLTREMSKQFQTKQSVIWPKLDTNPGSENKSPLSRNITNSPVSTNISNSPVSTRALPQPINNSETVTEVKSTVKPVERKGPMSMGDLLSGSPIKLRSQGSLNNNNNNNQPTVNEHKSEEKNLVSSKRQLETNVEKESTAKIPTLSMADLIKTSPMKARSQGSLIEINQPTFCELKFDNEDMAKKWFEQQSKFAVEQCKKLCQQVQTHDDFKTFNSKSPTLFNKFANNVDLAFQKNGKGDNVSESVAKVAKKMLEFGVSDNLKPLLSNPKTFLYLLNAIARNGQESDFRLFFKALLNKEQTGPADLVYAPLVLNEVLRSVAFYNLFKI